MTATVWEHPLPPTIAAVALGGVWTPITIGQSGSYVYRIEWPSQPTRTAIYLKIAPPAQHAELRDERARLDWLGALMRPPLHSPSTKQSLPPPPPDLGAPQAVAYAVAEPFAYLALTAVPGAMACDAIFADDVPLVARQLAAGLRRLHATDFARCPFDRRLARTLPEAAQRRTDGQVDVADFDDPASDPCTTLTWLHTHVPADEDLVFTHGDYCLPNVLIDPVERRISGLLDWGRAGVADRYQDLALAARSLTYNFGPGWEPFLWEAYGLPHPDQHKLTYYRLLDEFF